MHFSTKTARNSDNSNTSNKFLKFLVQGVLAPVVVSSTKKSLKNVGIENYYNVLCLL